MREEFKEKSRPEACCQGGKLQNLSQRRMFIKVFAVQCTWYKVPLSPIPAGILHLIGGLNRRLDAGKERMSQRENRALSLPPPKINRKQKTLNAV